MWNNRMTSFRSRDYPRSRQRFVIQQEYALRYYAMFAIVVMIGVAIRLNAQKEVTLFGIIGAGIAILLGNLMAHVQLKRKIAEIFFVNDTFSVINVHDILHQSEPQSFPLRFANPVREGDRISFHYEDQIMYINREDWGDEFDLIWNWFNQSHLDYSSTT